MSQFPASNTSHPPAVLVLASILALAGCGSDRGDPHALGGSISGLSASGLVLANGDDSLAISAGAIAFTMPGKQFSGTRYVLSIRAQPIGQRCVLANASGEMPDADMRDVVVNCVSDTPGGSSGTSLPAGYRVGGSVTGLTDDGLVLANGADTIGVPAGASTFMLPGAAASGAGYAVTVQTRPAWLDCSVSRGTGTVATADVGDVAVSCTDAVDVGTLAGAGWSGYAEGTGTAAEFNYPRGVAVDSTGTVYVADTSNHVIRKITAAGVVSTLAGAGVPGYADGSGTSAAFFTPTGIAVDAVGNVFVADRSNGRVRKITPAGVVSTLAGSGNFGSADGNGAAAEFGGPTGIAADGVGNLYVADSGNHRIRKITAAGEVSTLAGSGAGYADGTGPAARFDLPWSVAVDAAGNVYVADNNNQRIRKVSASGVTTTLAGSGTAGYGDGSASTARFDSPSGVAVDAAGRVYVADNGNQRIRRITPAGDVVTLAGGAYGNVDGAGASARFAYPAAVAVDGSGNVYVADNDNHAIRRIRRTP